MGDDHRLNRLLREKPTVARLASCCNGAISRFAALEELVHDSACLTFLRIFDAYCPRSTSGTGHGDQSMGRHFTR